MSQERKTNIPSHGREAVTWPANVPRTITQRLYSDPKCGIEIPFSKALREHMSTKISDPVKSEMEVVGKFYAEVLNVFTFLSGVGVMERLEKIEELLKDLKYELKHVTK